jgi:cbb3-type cytochrome c oxidase subunit III
MANDRLRCLMWRGTGISLLISAACLFYLGDSKASDTGGSVTFAKDIAPIFQEKCEECHHQGTAAPMSLSTYKEARPWAKSIRERVITRNMPPWHIDKTVGIQRFQNDSSLTDEQINAIVQWVDSGAPLGDVKDLPPPKQWPDNDWRLAKHFGPPDFVLKSEDYTMPAQGQDVWFRPVTDVPLTEPRWVRAVEVRPGATAGRKIMHHVLVGLLQEEAGAGPGRANPAEANAGPGLLMEWAIGKNYDVYRPNTGKLLSPGARISWELHLYAVGEQIRDHAELAVYLYPKGETPKYHTRSTLFHAYATTIDDFDIPPNSITTTQGFHALRQPARLESFQPHMHLRGKAMALKAILPDGAVQTLSYVNNFNFNWMNNYIYADDAAPVLPKGTIINVIAWHDNTARNKHNPDPDQWVGWGNRTIDEMAHAWVNVTYISEEDYKRWVAENTPNRPVSTAPRPRQ